MAKHSDIVNRKSPESLGLLQDPYDFSLVLGGPLYQLWRRTGLAGNTLELLRRRIIVISLFAIYLTGTFRDTALFGGGIHAVRCGLEFFGSDHVVFATDTPLGPIAPTIDVIKRLDIAESDRRKIFAGNAERLLKMKFS